MSFKPTNNPFDAINFDETPFQFYSDWEYSDEKQLNSSRGNRPVLNLGNILGNHRGKKATRSLRKVIELDQFDSDQDE